MFKQPVYPKNNMNRFLVLLNKSKLDSFWMFLFINWIVVYLFQSKGSSVSLHETAVWVTAAEVSECV